VHNIIACILAVDVNINEKFYIIISPRCFAAVVTIHYILLIAFSTILDGLLNQNVARNTVLRNLLNEVSTL